MSLLIQFPNVLSFTPRFLAVWAAVQSADKARLITGALALFLRQDVAIANRMARIALTNNFMPSMFLQTRGADRGSSEVAYAEAEKEEPDISDDDYDHDPRERDEETDNVFSREWSRNVPSTRDRVYDEHAWRQGNLGTEDNRMPNRGLFFSNLGSGLNASAQFDARMPRQSVVVDERVSSSYFAAHYENDDNSLFMNPYGFDSSIPYLNLSSNHYSVKRTGLLRGVLDRFLPSQSQMRDRFPRTVAFFDRFDPSLRRSERDSAL